MAGPILFFVPGDPKGQPRPRAFARKVGDKFQARVFDAGTAEGWKSQIAAVLREHVGAQVMAGAVRLSLDFVVRRPKAHFGTGKRSGQLRESAPFWCTQRPDIDNYAKAVMDCITQAGGVWHDDAQVSVLQVRKIFGERPGVAVSITEQTATYEP